MIAGCHAGIQRCSHISLTAGATAGWLSSQQTRSRGAVGSDNISASPSRLDVHWSTERASLKVGAAVYLLQRRLGAAPRHIRFGRVLAQCVALHLLAGRACSHLDSSLSCKQGLGELTLPQHYGPSSCQPCKTHCCSRKQCLPPVGNSAETASTDKNQV